MWEGRGDAGFFCFIVQSYAKLLGITSLCKEIVLFFKVKECYIAVCIHWFSLE